MIHWECIFCGNELSADDEEAGERIECPKCKAVDTVPEKQRHRKRDEMENGDNEEKSQPRKRRENVAPRRVDAPDASASIAAKLVGMFVLVVGIIATILLFSSASKIGDSGDELSRIYSVGGGTIHEAYFRGVGHALRGISTLVDGLALATLVVSLGIGIGLIVYNPRHVLIRR